MPLSRAGRSEVYRGRQEDLPRVSVIGRQDPGLPEAGRRDVFPVSVQDELSGEGILGQEVVAGDDVLPVQKILAMEADLVPVAGRAPDDVGVEECEAALVEHRGGKLELLALAAIGR